MNYCNISLNLSAQFAMCAAECEDKHIEPNYIDYASTPHKL